MTDKKDETAERVAQLEKELAELKAKVDPPKSTFTPQPYQRYDPTERMSMPLSALQAMVAAEPRGFMAGVVGDNRGPTGPSSAVSSSQSTGGSGPTNVPGSGTGWAREIPLGPSMHQRYVDQQFDAQDAKDRAELIRQHAQLEAMDKLSEQGEKLQKLADQVAEHDKK
jgi:hypothetical protein